VQPLSYVVFTQQRRRPTYASKNGRGRNAISIGFTAHDEAMRARFGEDLEDGLAGENILVQTDRLVHKADVRDGVVIVLQDGRVVRLARILVAEPCVGFTRYALRPKPEPRWDLHGARSGPCGCHLGIGIEFPNP
jgi:hypothetical protein